jgi:prophage regulatory protein
MSTPTDPSSRPLRVIRLRELLKRVPYSTSTIYARVREGKFPAPVSLGGNSGNSVGWLEHEVEAWIEARMAERSEPPTTARTPVTIPINAPSLPMRPAGVVERPEPQPQQSVAVAR